VEPNLVEFYQATGQEEVSKMKSVITGTEIPEDEYWIWKVHAHGYGRCTVRNDITDRHNNTCGRCSTGKEELFEFIDPLSGGYHKWCHKCMMELRNFIYKRKGETCPVCGFGIASIGGGIITCVFHHTWTEHEVKAHTIISREGK
jgi:hypothetical protein